METGVLNASQATAAGGSKAAKKPSQEMDKNAFLMLLVAQLKSQDPTQTQDPAQMVQQMTAFSGLEQAQNTNRLLEGIQLQNQGMFQAQAASLVGKRVRVASTALDLKDGKATLGLDLEARALVTVTLKDAQGNVVRVFDRGLQESGTHLVDWDGKDAQGRTMPEGTYTVQVDAKAADGTKVGASPSAFAKVDAMTFLNGTVFVQAAGRRFSLADIREISA